MSALRNCATGSNRDPARECFRSEDFGRTNCAQLLLNNELIGPSHRNPQVHPLPCLQPIAANCVAIGGAEVIPGVSSLQTNHADAIAMNHQGRLLVDAHADLIGKLDDGSAHAFLSLASGEMRIDNGVRIQCEPMSVFDLLIAAFDHDVGHDAAPEEVPETIPPRDSTPLIPS